MQIQIYLVFMQICEAASSQCHVVILCIARVIDQSASRRGRVCFIMHFYVVYLSHIMTFDIAFDSESIILSNVKPYALPHSRF